MFEESTAQTGSFSNVIHASVRQLVRLTSSDIQGAPHSKQNHEISFNKCWLFEITGNCSILALHNRTSSQASNLCCCETTTNQPTNRPTEWLSSVECNCTATGDPIDFLPYTLLVCNNPEVGNIWCINQQDCLPYFMIMISQWNEQYLSATIAICSRHNICLIFYCT